MKPDIDGCQSNLYVMLKQLMFFKSFTTSFLGEIFWWTDHVIIFYFPAYTESTNMGIWFVGTSNQLFIRGS